MVAGVIGRKKFIYGLWGQGVNTATHMGSQGQADTIQVTRATNELIRDEFICEPRGMVNVKNRGETETWFVVGPKDGRVEADLVLTAV